MKRLYFWTWAFIIAGLVVFIASGIWFYKYPNPSEYFPYLGGAVILWMFAGFSEALKRVIGKQSDLEVSQSELQRWATEQERLKENKY